MGQREVLEVYDFSVLSWCFAGELAYHLNGIFGNSGVNSNGPVHPGGKFSEKR